MEYLKPEELLLINQYLDRQGLTFKPLREEMFDHIIDDINGKINQGASFEEAWSNITGEIPEDHFKTMQKEVMETINKKFTLPKGLSYLSLLLILTMVTFKVMHLSLSGILLLITFGTIGASLFFGTLYGLYPFKDKTESILLIGTLVGVEIFLLSFGLQVLHILAPYSILRVVSIILLLIFYPAVTWHLSRSSNNNNQLLAQLHQKYSPVIERYLMALLVIALTLRFISLGFGVTPDVSHILLFLVMAGAGMQFFALNWHGQQGQNHWMQISVIIAFTGFILPAISWMGNPIFSKNLIIILTALFFMLSAGIAYFKSEVQENKLMLNLFITLIGWLYLSWLLIHIGFLGISFSYIFNIPVLVILLAFLIYFIKSPLLKMFLMIVISHYMYEYPIQLGLW